MLGTEPTVVQGRRLLGWPGRAVGCLVGAAVAAVLGGIIGSVPAGAAGAFAGGAFTGWTFAVSVLTVAADAEDVGKADADVIVGAGIDGAGACCVGPVGAASGPGP